MNNGSSKRIIISIIVSLTLLIFGWIFTSIGRVNGRVDDTNTKVNEINGAVGDIKGDIKGIRENLATNMEWIKASLTELKDK